ncbi:hypothetical protein C8Q77DRAFT_768530 [Trametes polyzona]|nr:hypothetical protein C8Q77DRAFT_768530 [Trametes polyzona]
MLSTARVVSFALLVLALFGFAEASVASRREATNAERLARGLGPARPRRLYSGSRTNAARSAPSGTANNIRIGTIAIFASGGSPANGAAPIGWLGQYSVVEGANDAFVYQWTDAFNNAPVQLECTNDPGFRLGAYVHDSNTILGGGLTNYAKLANTDVHTNVGSPGAAYSSNKYATGSAVTTIYHVDKTTGRLAIYWINPDGRAKNDLPILLFENAVYITGDVNTFHTVTGSTASTARPVDLYFIGPDTVQLVQ